MSTHKQRGLSLLELMLSLSLSSFLLVILLHYYIYSKNQYHHFEQDLEQFIDEQWIAALLQDSIRRAGFSPCVGTDHLIKIDSRSVKNLLESVSIGEQRISLRRMNNPVNLIQFINSRQILVSAPLLFSVHQPILIADCYHGEIHELESIHQSKNHFLLNLKTPLKMVFSGPTCVGEWLEEIFYMAEGHPESLKYKRNQAETLSLTIKHLSTSIIQKYPRIVHILLDSKNGERLAFDTQVRTP